ncbi:hypothetical protein V5799_026631 [Amblyomma americanum]|uniref:Uncharacterized protein n=1 Tax=Amblyomma americanum TaxID=6943 RepID=A0AAQ4DI12_AMBAM
MMLLSSRYCAVRGITHRRLDPIHVTQAQACVLLCWGLGAARCHRTLVQSGTLIRLYRADTALVAFNHSLTMSSANRRPLPVNQRPRLAG